MENASKALIIAGAILLSILIIGLGMMVFNNAKNALTSANLDAEQIDAFNSKLETYIGDDKRGTDVRTLCDTVKSSNASAEEENFVKLIYTDGSNKEFTSQSDILNLRNEIKNGKRYDVKANYNKDTKLIDKITISDPITTSKPETPEG